MSPNSKSWPDSRHAAQALRVAAGRGGGGGCWRGRDKHWLHPAPLCPQLTSHRHPSSPPTCPTPLVSCWTAAIFPHQALGVLPFASWLNYLQTGNSGTVGLSLPLRVLTTPGWGLSRRPPKGSLPRLPPPGWQQAPSSAPPNEKLAARSLCMAQELEQVSVRTEEVSR